MKKATNDSQHPAPWWDGCTIFATASDSMDGYLAEPRKSQHVQARKLIEGADVTVGTVAIVLEAPYRIDLEAAAIADYIAKHFGHDGEILDDMRKLPGVVDCRNSRPATAPRSEERSAPPNCRAWWEGPGIKLEVVDETDTENYNSWQVRVWETRLGIGFIRGTLAIVVANECGLEVVTYETNGKALAEKIAADPSILDTLDNPNVLDLRESGGPARAQVDAAPSIDQFHKVFRGMIEGLGIGVGEDDDGLLMPDGSIRHLFSVDFGNDNRVMFPGPVNTDRPKINIPWRQS